MIEIINADARKIPLPDKSVNMCVTSPPYWGLRSYLDSDDPMKKNELGAEPTPEEYVANMVRVFREIWRVMADDGTLWLNLGDSYAGNNSQASNNGRAGFGNKRERVVNRTAEGLKTKDLVGIPWMVAFALRADGWYLRQDIIWHKPNPMPESVTDRCTKAHEYIFLLSKSRQYYYDHEAIREENSETSHTGGTYKNDWKYAEIKNVEKSGMKKGAVIPRNGRNKRSVWTVTTKPYKGAHFATFPQDLIIPCIKAGSKPGGVVIDPFNGSGTTGEVCARLERSYIGIELNREYIGLSHERLAQYKIQPRLWA